MIFDVYGAKWKEKYELAKAYYEYNNNLEIPRSFKTNNGYEYDENGINLGDWIHTNRKAYKGRGCSKITEEQIRLLEEIGMIFDVYGANWKEKYELAKAYYEYNNNLEIPKGFRTNNGYEYDENGINLGNWIRDKRQSYSGRINSKITEEQIRLLEEIGIIWFSKNKDDKLQLEKLTEENITRKNIEILNRARSLLNKCSDSELLSKEEINQQFLDELNHMSRRK